MFWNLIGKVAAPGFIMNLASWLLNNSAAVRSATSARASPVARNARKQTHQALIGIGVRHIKFAGMEQFPDIFAIGNNLLLVLLKKV